MKKVFLVSMLSISFVACAYLADNYFYPLLKPVIEPSWQTGKTQLLSWLAVLSDNGNAKAKAVKVNRPQQDVLLRQAQSQLIGLSSAVSTGGVIQSEVHPTNEIKQYRQEYEQADNIDDKRAALVELVEVDKKNALSLLEKAYQNQDAGLRLEAVEQLSTFNQHDRAVKILLSALNDPDPAVVMEALEGLAHNSDKKVISGLGKIAANHPDQLIRQVAADYLGQVQGISE
ncbi:HEAT repeat domain-containing protein [Methyloglobulus sp.]|uniref:HEAT repeat domain-containing protein n=1 Tax=Methyloglobulus sp. TaxID=2518622 RepID=UPI0032B77BBD